MLGMSEGLADTARDEVQVGKEVYGRDANKDSKPLRQKSTWELKAELPMIFLHDVLRAAAASIPDENHRLAAFL